MPRDFLILQVRVAVSVERKVEKHEHFASAHLRHAELNVYCMREHTQQILHIHEDTFHYSLHSFQH